MKENDDPITEKELDSYLKGEPDSYGYFKLLKDMIECGPVTEPNESLKS